jgi:hypothetical protein
MNLFYLFHDVFAGKQLFFAFESFTYIVVSLHIEKEILFQNEKRLDDLLS